jgi:hypothetical protein
MPPTLLLASLVLPLVLPPVLSLLLPPLLLPLPSLARVRLLHSRRKLARACPPPEGHRKKKKKKTQRIRYTASNKESYLVACNVLGFADWRSPI